MKTEFDIGDFVWVLFKVRGISIASKNDISYDISEVSSNRRGMELLNKEEKELVKANFKEEYDIDSGTYRTKFYRIVESEEKRGKWLTKQEPNDAEPIILYKCSRCDKELGMVRPIVDGKIVYNYCPFCGSKMKDEE